MTFTQDSRNNSTITQDSRQAVASLSQDSRTTAQVGAGRLKLALLLPITLYNSTGGKPVLTLDTRH